jgi:hypothetical protein
MSKKGGRADFINHPTVSATPYEVHRRSEENAIALNWSEVPDRCRAKIAGGREGSVAASG